MRSEGAVWASTKRATGYCSASGYRMPGRSHGGSHAACHWGETTFGHAASTSTSAASATRRPVAGCHSAATPSASPTAIAGSTG